MRRVRRTPRSPGWLLLLLLGPACSDPAPPIRWTPPADVLLPRVAGNAELDVRAPDLWIGTEQMVLSRLDRQTGGRTQRQVLTYDRHIAPGDKLGGDASALRIQPLFEAVSDLPRAEPAAINLFVDRDVPYRVVTEVVYTLGQVGFVAYAFAVDDPARSALYVMAPRFGGSEPEPPGTAPLALVIDVEPSGYGLSSATVDIATAAECAGDGSRCDVEGGPGALEAALERLKARYPDNHTATLRAGDDAAWSEVASALSATAGDPAHPLFHSQMLGVPRRSTP